MEGAPIEIGDAPLDPTAQVEYAGPLMDLPRGTVLNPDGSVTLTLDFPVTLKLRQVGSGAPVREEPFTQLVLRRLNGADVRKMIGSKNSDNTGLALSSGLGPAKLAMLQNVMNARDESAARDVVSELLGGSYTGLPESAEEEPDGIRLALSVPAVDEEGVVQETLFFKHITAAQRRQAAEAPNLLDWAIAMATGCSPKMAKSLVDSLDGADAIAVYKVVLFLCGSGRRAGR